MDVKNGSEEAERAIDEKVSQKLHLDWWAFIIACVVALGLLIWQWAGGTPSIPFKEVVKWLLP